MKSVFWFKDQRRTTNLYWVINIIPNYFIFRIFSIKKLNKIIRKNFSLILCKNYGKIEEWPMGDSNPQPEI